MSSVHPLIVWSAEFCITCLMMFVSDIMGDQIVLAYSRMGLVIILYVMVNVFFGLPPCVVVSVFRM